VPQRLEGGSEGASRRLGYQPALDGVRAVAIALVLSYHAFNWPPGGFLGVHLFFVLSGFLITALLLQEWDAKGSISLRHFYRRRVLRLAPALVALLVTYSLVQVLRRIAGNSTLELGTAMKGVLISAFYVSNVFQAAGYVIATPIIHLWSLATEEQFYLLWPFLLLFGLRLGVRRRVLEFFLVGAIALVVINRVFWALSGAPTERLYFAPDTSFDAILIGCLLGLWFVSGRTPRVFYWTLLLPFLLATGLLIFFVASWEGSLLKRGLETAPLVFAGKISYSLYLWHLMALNAVRGSAGPVAGLVFAVAIATASYYLIELPFLRKKAQDRAEVERRPPERRRRLPSVRRERRAVGAR
jgi:peptidoglycan/LPS O-acetylase OafA/YrhL